jgi:hypothetical protein
LYLPYHYCQLAKKDGSIQHPSHTHSLEMMVQFTLPMLKKGAFAFYCSAIPRGAAAAAALLLTYIKSVD